MSTELTRRSIASVARADFTVEQTNLIRATVAKDATNAELGMFLELCKRYELDPFAGQIYCAKMRGRNGQTGRVAIIIGRDGMLAIANRHPEFQGFRSDVVRENDMFKVKHSGGDAKVEHEYEGDHRKRGAIVGAWAIVERKGRPDRYFYAPIEEYEPQGNVSEFSPWKKQRSVMIEKCAVSTALRLAFEIAGLIGEEEASHQLTSGDPVITPGEIEWGDDEQVADRLAQLFAAANAAKPGAFPPAKMKLLLAGKTQGEREDLLAELTEFIEAHDGIIPAPTEREEDLVAEHEVEPEPEEAEFEPIPPEPDE